MDVYVVVRSFVVRGVMVIIIIILLLRYYIIIIVVRWVDGFTRNYHRQNENISLQLDILQNGMQQSLNAGVV